MRRLTFGLSAAAACFYLAANLLLDDTDPPRALLGVLIGAAVLLGGTYTLAGSAPWAVLCYAGAFLLGVLGHLALGDPAQGWTAFVAVLGAVAAALSGLAAVAARATPPTPGRAAGRPAGSRPRPSPR